MSTARKFETKQVNSVHGPIVPADIRDGDFINAKLVSSDGSFKGSLDYRVWKLSPLGVELIIKDQTVPKGSAVDLELIVGDQRSKLSGLVVDDLGEDQGNKLMYVRLMPRVKERIGSIERRTSDRWICSDEFYPTAVASNPARFNDFLYFKIKDISAGGLKLQSSLRNKFIVPGMVFDCIVNFPMVSQVKMKFEVKSIRVELQYGKEVLAIGASFDRTNKSLVETVAQYLLQFGSAESLDELRENGLHSAKVSEAVSFSYVRTKEEYDQVLALRFEAYKSAGKIPAGTTLSDMADSYDSRARIVIGKFKGQVVASARLIFNQFDDSMEQEKFVKWPNDLPKRNEMVEIMRACTRVDFRKSDLLIAMFKFIAVTVAQSRRKWIIICATDDMIPLYEKIGFNQLGLSYLHNKLNNLKHNVLLANVPDAMEGKTVGLITWGIVWSEVSSYLEQYGVIKPDPMTNIRLTIYRLLKPLAELVYGIQKNTRRRRYKVIDAQSTSVPATES